MAQIKLAAAKKGVTRVEVRDRKLMLTRRGDFVLVGGKFPRLVGPTIQEHLPETLDLVKKL
jgi:transcription-repair coupling factor (superfamily II helicase)